MRYLACLLVVLLSCTASAQTWNQWRGPDHNGVSSETGMLAHWPAEGPKLLWRNDALGAGYSNFSFFDGKIFSMGDRDGSCYLYALDAATGEIWKRAIGATGGGGGYAGPRSTPATDGKLVFALGQFGDFACAEAATGKPLWKINVEKELGAKIMSGWSFSMSPVIDGEQVVLPIGGEQGTVVAFAKTGKGPKILWRSKELTDLSAYTSVVPVTFGGTRQYLVFTDKRVAGVSAKNGKVLWQANCPGKVAVCSDPAFHIEDKTCYIIASSAYDTGARGFKVTGSRTNFKVEEIYGADRSLQNHHGGIVEVGGHFYLLTQRELVCVDPKTGKTLWKNRSVGKGAIMAVDGKLIVRGEGGEGTVALVAVSPEAYKELGRFDQPDRSDKNSWTYPTVFDGKLYIRDQGLLLCYQVK